MEDGSMILVGPVRMEKKFWTESEVSIFSSFHRTQVRNFVSKLKVELNSWFDCCNIQLIKYADFYNSIKDNLICIPWLH